MDVTTLEKKLMLMSAGDIGAFTDIYNEMKTPVFTVVLRIVISRADAEDILQETFLRLFKNGIPDKTENPKAYIYAIARNLSLDLLRKKKPDELTDSIPCPGTPADEYITDAIDIDRALSFLSVYERETVTLHINGGLKFREIAEATKTPVGTVLWRYKTAIKKLRGLLSR